jgi:hypothetical protein
VLQRNKQAIEQKTKAERVWQALQSYPPRTSYVKSLLITPFLEKHTEQLRLLEMVHPYLTTLTIRGVRGSTVPLLGESPSKHNFYTKFSGKKLKLERLRDLRVHIGDDDDFKQIFGLMKGMPTLKTLELEAYEKEHEWPTLDRTDITAIPKMPGLVHLSINVMFVGMANALIGLLAKAPNLKHLAIDGKWSPLPRSPGLKAIKKHKGIEAVSWFAPSRIPARDLFDGDTQPNLTTLVETRTDEGEADECLLHVSVFQISVGFAQLTVSVPQMVLKIPVAAMMTRYVLLHTHRPSVGDYALTGVRTLTEEDAAKRAEVLHPMKAWFARSLKYAPDLTEIHFGHKYDGACFPGTKRSSIPDQVKDAYEPWGWLKPTIPTEHWERLGWRGAIIRTYSRPDNGAREFVHIRLLSRSVYLDSTATYVGAQRQRSDFGFYRYQPLTDSVLATIYDLAGMPSAFLEGGRNLTLPAQAWEALDDYACKRNRKLGIDEQREGEFDDMDTEDDSVAESEDSENSDWIDWTTQAKYTDDDDDDSGSDVGGSMHDIDSDV